MLYGGQYEADLRTREEERGAMEASFQSQLRDKSIEINNLLVEVDNALKSNRDEVTETRVSTGLP